LKIQGTEVPARFVIVDGRFVEPDPTVRSSGN
jgi:hypothetical protein